MHGGISGVGQVVGAYRLERLVATSGTCDIYESFHVESGARVAVKLHRYPEPGGDVHLERVFRRQALATRLVDHPAIVRVYEDGLWLGHRYLVMELVDGENLSIRVRRAGRLPWREAVRIASDVAGAMRAAHERGVVHGDLKPGNLLLAGPPESEAPEVKIIDFSHPALASRDPSGDPSSDGDDEDAEAYLGPFTLAFASPEQLRRLPLDGRTDVYTLGATLHCMLAGEAPFYDRVSGVDSERPTLEEPPPPGERKWTDLVRATLEEPPPPVEKTAPDVPPELSALLRRMMAKAPRGRPSMAEVAEALAQIRAQRRE